MVLAEGPLGPGGERKFEKVEKEGEEGGGGERSGTISRCRGRAEWGRAGCERRGRC